MAELFQFKDFNIKREKKVFTGTRLFQDDILNLDILVHDFRELDSTEKPGTKYIQFQIEKDNIMHVYNSGSSVLKEMIERVDKDKYPFKTKIIKKDRALSFT